MIGMFGDIVFEVSDESILNFEGFTRNTASKYENHELIGQKPRTEFVAPGLDTVSFTVLLNANHGVKPREEMNRWLEYCRGGDAETLIIGTGALGVDKWVVTSVSQHWDSIYNMGELVAGKVDVTLQEYVSNMWTVQGYREDLKKIAAAKAGKSIAENASEEYDLDKSDFSEVIDFFKKISSDDPSKINSVVGEDSLLTGAVESLGSSINVPNGMQRPVILRYISRKLEESTSFRLQFNAKTNNLSIFNAHVKYEVPAECVLIFELEIVDAVKVLQALEGVSHE